MRLKLYAPEQPDIRNLKSHLMRRLGLALDQFGDEVDLVTVWLQDLDGPRGDRRCFVRIKFVGKDVAVESDADEMTTAIDFAVSQAGRAFQRALRTERERPGTRKRRTGKRT